MTDCKEIGEKLLDWVEGELSGSEQARVAAHLQECSSCKDEVRLLQAMTRSIAGLPELAAPKGIEARVMARLRGQGRAQAAPSWFAGLLSARPAMAAAGALAVVLLLVGGFLFWGRTAGTGAAQIAAVPSGVRLDISTGAANVEGNPASTGTMLAEGGLLEVSGDFKGKLIYPDGSWVRVRPGASVRVFRRSLGLKSGQVWLKVTKGGEGFQVETPQAVVAVRGTVFGVDYDDVQGRTAVQVEEGRVEVTTPQDSQMLGAGDSARVIADLKVVREQGFPELFGMDRGDFVGKLRKNGIDLPVAVTPTGATPDPEAEPSGN